jgi:hypothetical protein
LADASRIDHVARLIKDQIAMGYRPRAVVCSAMGKTTNNLLSAGEFALGTRAFVCDGGGLLKHILFSSMLFCFPPRGPRVRRCHPDPPCQHHGRVRHGRSHTGGCQRPPGRM